MEKVADIISLSVVVSLLTLSSMAMYNSSAILRVCDFERKV
jgi:hypothetical protein